MSIGRWFAALVIILGVDAFAASALDRQMHYPGTPPGPARAEVQEDRISLGTSAITVTWTIGPQGIRRQGVRDEQASKTLELQGEAFVVVCTQGVSYAASALIPEGKPQSARLTPDPQSSRYAGRLAGYKVEIPFRTADDHFRIVWRGTATDGGSYVREEIEIAPLGARGGQSPFSSRNVVGKITPPGDEKGDSPRPNFGGGAELKEIIWLEEALAGGKPAGVVEGVPILCGNCYLGSENPHAQVSCQDANDNNVVCRVPCPVELKPDDSYSAGFVWGVTPPGQLRRGFLYYLERERAHPYRPFLHYNSWYDISFGGVFLNEAVCLEAIRVTGEQLIRPYGVVMDSFVFDDGWDDPKTLWGFCPEFLKGFGPHADLARQYGSRVGVWLSPHGGYGRSRELRLDSGRRQGYELNASGFSLAGPEYYRAFKRACVEMIRRYQVNYFKFDGIAKGVNVGGVDPEYLRDTEAIRRLMLELRREEPQVYINFTTGSWPSPFWLLFADSLWRQGGDMGRAGVGSSQQQWLTYRDQEVYRNVVLRSPLYPLNALMTQGVAYSQHGMPGRRDFTSAGFKDDVRAFFGAGTSLQELYIRPQKLTADDWRVLAEAAKWSRANADVLVDTHWIGGDPGKLEVYGYASWSPRKGIIMLRNPSDKPQAFSLDVGQAFELPPGAPQMYALKSPWAEDAEKRPLAATAGHGLRIDLGPLEVLVFDATAVGSSGPSGFAAWSVGGAEAGNRNCRLFYFAYQ